MIGDRIRELRDGLNMSRAEFGEKLSVSADVVNNWERNRVTFTGSTIKLISLVYHVREEWLRTGEGPMYEETPKEYVESLIEKHNLGPGGQMLMRSLLRFYEELGEEATLKVIAEILPDAQQVVGEAEVEQFNQYLARNEGSEGSSQESAGSA